MSNRIYCTWDLLTTPFTKRALNMVVVPGNLPIALALTFVVLSPLLHSRKRHLFGLVCPCCTRGVTNSVHNYCIFRIFGHFWALSQILDAQWQCQIQTGTTLLLHNICTTHFLVINTTTQIQHNYYAFLAINTTPQTQGHYTFWYTFTRLLCLGGSVTRLKSIVMIRFEQFCSC